MKSLRWAVGLVILVGSSYARADLKEYAAQKMLRRNYPAGYQRMTESTILSQTFTQKIDHANPSDARTFQQRYYISLSDKAGQKAPVIFYICGESTCGEGSQGGVVNYWADQIGASVVVLEHRYYGRSQPFPTLAKENMKYLTMENALEDLATFQIAMMKDPRLQGPWIAIGGSYPGMLSAFYRLKHPELVVGALASSAPVRAKAEFVEYDQAVSEAVTPECRAQMKTVVREVEKALDNPATHDQIKEVFGGSQITDDVDFLAVVADMASIAIQYGKKDMMCSALVGDKPVEGYANVGSQMFAWFGISALEDSTQGALSEDPNDYLAGFGMRPWFYQSCTQFGFFQVAHNDEHVTVRSSRINMDFYNRVCKNLFGVDPLNVDPVNADFYQPLLEKPTSHIVFTNGAEDPWARLSITNEAGNNTNQDTVSVTIPFASHCTDLVGFGGNAAAAQKTTIESFREWTK